MIESQERLESELNLIKKRLSELEVEVQAKKENKENKEKKDIEVKNIAENESNEEKQNTSENEFNSLCKKSFLTNEEFDKIITYAKKDNR